MPGFIQVRITIALTVLGAIAAEAKPQLKRVETLGMPGLSGQCPLNAAPGDDGAIDPSVRRLFKDMTVVDGALSLEVHTSCCTASSAACSGKNAHQNLNCYHRKFMDDYRKLIEKNGIQVGSTQWNERFFKRAQLATLRGKGLRLIRTSHDMDSLNRSANSASF